MAEARKTRPGWTVRRFSSHAEADQHDAEYWMRLTPEARVELAWQLSLEQHQLAGLCSDAPRLDRSFERIIRR
ncbi:MAG: hypothetical protein EPN33_07560 [Acidobacteria bacterium]|nr:MAG: hypothetical protein EPN33_07560 [Acidobacteriota bacterium]